MKRMKKMKLTEKELHTKSKTQPKNEKQAKWTVKQRQKTTKNTHMMDQIRNAHTTIPADTQGFLYASFITV